MDDLLPVFVVAAAAFGLWWWLHRRGADFRQAESRLLRICLGNTEQMERLIRAEMTRAPGISRSEAASRAVFRHERDNR